MRLKLFLILVFISSFSYSEIVFSDLVEKKVRKTIHKYLKLELYDYHAVSSIPELGIKKDHIFKISKNEKSVGYFALNQSMGQYDNFDYLVLFDQNLEIITVKIITYREDYGFEICSKWWLSQFIGKKAGKNMKYKENIDALSGATISAESITVSLKVLSENMLQWQDFGIL